MSTRNPILPGFNPDPSICHVNSDYFLATSTFEFFPGVAIYHSTDLVDWVLIGHALTRHSQLTIRGTQPGFGVWAPTLRHHKGRFYVATAIAQGWGDQSTTPRGFYVSTDNIWDDTTWTDPVFFDVLGIDQDLFFDDDGRTYLSVAKTKNDGLPHPTWEAIWGVEIDLASGRNKGSPILLRRSTTDSGVAEGSHIFKRGGWYYLCVAEGGTEEGHQEWIFRSESPLGPYEEPEAKGFNPILYNAPDLPIRCTGHTDFVEATDGQWWAVFLGLRPSSSSGIAHMGRETFIAPVEWDSQGWPVINGGRPVTSEVRGLPHSKPPGAWTDPFSKSGLTKGWYHSQTPYRKEYNTTEREGWLALYGNGYMIHDSACPSMLLRKQNSLSGNWSVRIDFTPSNEYEEAGTTVFRSKFGFIALLLRKRRGAPKQVVLRWTDKETDSYKEIVRDLDTDRPVDLAFRASPNAYTCLIKTVDDDEYCEMATVSSGVLQREDKFGSYFTGVHLGVFAQNSNHTSNLVPAYFTQISFSPAE